jgi:hypothetical protein
MVSVVLDNVAAGVSRREILESYPGVEDADIDAALAYAAELTREGTVALPLELGARDSRSTRTCYLLHDRNARPFGAAGPFPVFVKP